MEARKVTKEVESNRAGIRGKEKDMERAQTEEKEKEKCKDHPKDQQAKPYSTANAMDAENKDTPKEDVHKWERGSRGIAIHVEERDIHGINVPSSHMEKPKEKEKEE